MIINVDALKNLDIEQFSSDLDDLKKEITNNANDEDVQGDEAIILEVIDVIQEEISKRKGKSKKNDPKSDVRFLAYLNLFNTIMDGDMDEGFDENDLDEDFDDEDSDEDLEEDES